MPHSESGFCLPIMFFSFCLIVSGCVDSAQPLDFPPQHIILIVVDSLRADHLSCFGYERNTSPFIDHLASQSVFFTRAYSQSSYTVHSVLSVFTGLYPSSNPWGTGQYANTNPDLSDMAQLFSRADYYTGCFTTNPALGKTDIRASFDEYESLTPDLKSSGHGVRLTNRALQFMETHKSQNTFLYLHYNGPHWPYAPPDDYYLRFASEIFPSPLRLEEDVRPNVPALVADGFGPGDPRFEDMVIRYDGEIAFEDNAIRTFFEGLRELGQLDNVLLVFTADHGEEFLEHGFVEHAWTLFPESIHVPLFFWMPGVLESERIDVPVGLVDLFPTLVDLVALPAIPHRYDGISLFSQVDGRWRPRPQEKPIISEFLAATRNMVRAVVQGDYLYVAATKWLSPAECSNLVQEDFPTVRWELIAGIRPEPEYWEPLQYEALFDLRADPLAQEDIISKNVVVCDQMRKIIHEYRENCPPPISDRHKIWRLPEFITPEIRAFLTEHGYAVVDDTVSEDSDAAITETEESIINLGYF